MRNAKPPADARRFYYTRKEANVEGMKEKAGTAGITVGSAIGAIIKLAYYITVTLAMIKYLRG